MRVIVAQSDPGRRQCVVNSVLAHGSGFQVVEASGDYGGAAARIGAGDFDLLVTQVRFGDGGKLGKNDGLALAHSAYEACRAGTIFLSDEPPDDEVVNAASDANILTYIQCVNSQLEPNSEALLRLALTQFATSRKKEADRIWLASAIAEQGSAVVYIDGATNAIGYCNSAASQMLGFIRSSPGAAPWWEALGSGARGDHPLTYAVDAGVRIALPPTALDRPGGGEVIVSGLVSPKLHSGRPMTLLLLRECNNTELNEVAEEIVETDMVAILGVDQFSFGPTWDAGDTSRFMIDVRSSLLEIVRAQDIASLPLGNSIAIVLKDIDVEESLDVTNAILSHLRSVPQHYGPGAAQVRFGVGLAHRKKVGTPLQALVAAHNAMLCTQQSALSPRVKEASKWDKSQLCGSNFSTDGVFADSYRSKDYIAYLSHLTSLHLQPEKPEDYHAAVLGLTLRQPGVLRLGIFRKCKDGSYRYLAGGKRMKSGFAALPEEELPKAFSPDTSKLKTDIFSGGGSVWPHSRVLIQRLSYRRIDLGYLAFEFEKVVSPGMAPFSLDTGALHFLAGSVPGLKEAPDAPEIPDDGVVRVATPLDKEIEGYVVDNMEGAVDQATFLAKLDVPVAIIGPRGTGKMYVARIVHQEAGGADDMMVQLDCREFRNRDEAVARIGKALQRSEGKTLVFKSPHLMAPDAQLKLAKQLSSRTLADVKPARYLPKAKYVALFPDTLDKLIRHHGLSEKLASVFAGYPIKVPPVKDRKQAVLRWAHKILGQESVARDRPIKGFTPDAEQAMLSHEWPGNISEMRQCIVGALEKTDKEWITPVDLGIFKGISAEGTPSTLDPVPFLATLESERGGEEDYSPTTLEDLDVALGEAVNSVAQAQSEPPLGAWLEDDLVLAVADRYQGDLRLSAEFLHTKPRNIGRWMPKILTRQHERNSSPVWSAPRRCIGEWVRETPHTEESPMDILSNLLVSHIASQCAGASVARRARIMGVSVPTYQKRLQQAVEPGEN